MLVTQLRKYPLEYKLNRSRNGIPDFFSLDNRRTITVPVLTIPMAWLMRLNLWSRTHLKMSTVYSIMHCIPTLSSHSIVDCGISLYSSRHYVEVSSQPRILSSLLRYLRRIICRELKIPVTLNNLRRDLLLRFLGWATYFLEGRCTYLNSIPCK